MQWALGTVGRVPTDGQVDSGATLTGPREREEREYYCGPGAQQPATSPELQIRRCKIDDTLHFSHYGFLFFAAPASFHAHSFLASFFVYRANFFPYYVRKMAKSWYRYTKPSQAIGCALQKQSNELTCRYTDCKKYLLFASNDPMVIASGSWQLI